LNSTAMLRCEESRGFASFPMLAPLALICCCAAPTLAQQLQLSPQQAVDYAMQHRPELRASQDLIAADEKNRTQAGAIPNPRLLFRKEDFVDHPWLGESSQVYYEGSELIEISGKRGGRLAVADQDLARARIQTEAQCRQIALNVRELYWKAEAAQALAALDADDDAFFQQIVSYHLESGKFSVRVSPDLASFGGLIVRWPSLSIDRRASSWSGSCSPAF
jgi:hypothetical protein